MSLHQCSSTPKSPLLHYALVPALLEVRTEDDITLRYRFEANLVNIHHLKTPFKMSVYSTVDLQYADDVVTASHSAEALQRNLNAFQKAYKRVGLETSLTKTEVFAFSTLDGHDRDRIYNLESRSTTRISGRPINSVTSPLSSPTTATSMLRSEPESTLPARPLCVYET